MCEKAGATLVVARLDRLSRSVCFVAGLMEFGIEFVLADQPRATRLAIHIMAAVAQQQREATSRRTKDALAGAKTRGAKLGNPRWRESIADARAARVKVKAEPGTAHLIRELRAERKSLRAIAEQLNATGLRTPSGAKWYASTIRAALCADEPVPPSAL